jgi:stearoyl-CoA desaturase (delta-9 desaturase)
VAGEWHNNHHLYPQSARSGFLPYQVDFAWMYIRCLSLVGAVNSYKDNKKDFLNDYRKPYLAKKAAGKQTEIVAEPITVNDKVLTKK